MQATAEKEKRDKELKEFNELMAAVAELPEDKRNIVAIYSQGVLAMANIQQGRGQR